jgi:hypothetical protein
MTRKKEDRHAFFYKALAGQMEPTLASLIYFNLLHMCILQQAPAFSVLMKPRLLKNFL